MTIFLTLIGCVLVFALFARWIFLEIFKKDIDTTRKLRVISIAEKSTVNGETYFKVKCKPCKTQDDYLNLEIDFEKTITINLFEIKDINVGNEIVFDKFVNKELKWDK